MASEAIPAGAGFAVGGKTAQEWSKNAATRIKRS